MLGLVALFARLAPHAPMEDAGERIERLRTRNVAIVLRDESGNPLDHARYRLEMTRHEFLFGANLYEFGRFDDVRDERLYLERFDAVFNFATLPFYLGEYREDGTRRDGDRIERMIAWAEAHDITLKGHPLLWHFPTTIPDWLPDDSDAIKDVHRRRIQEIVTRYKGRIAYWDVVNEPTLAWLFDSPISEWEREVGPVEVTRDALHWAREVDREATLIVNEVNVGPGPWHLLALTQPGRVFEMLASDVEHHFLSFHDFVKQLLETFSDIHAIGLQAHMHTGSWPLRLVWRMCEEHADLRLPIHISEVTVLSGDPKIIRPHDPSWQPAWPSTEAGEAEQAAYLRDLYTLLFSHEAVASITWWDLSDRFAWMQAPAGLLRGDLSPKPAYLVLRDLIRRQWWTRSEGRADASGTIEVRGFCGDYDLEVDGARAVLRIDCDAPDGQRIEPVFRKSHSKSHSRPDPVG
jgi:endo-1,4-beta-xylanase